MITLKIFGRREVNSVLVSRVLISGEYFTSSLSFIEGEISLRLLVNMEKFTPRLERHLVSPMV